MNRRDFLALMGGAAAFPRLASAQQPARRPVVAYLAITTIDASADRLEPFRLAMRAAGWIDGQNYALAVRSTDGLNDRLGPLTQELLALKPDVLVAEGTRGATTAAQATSTVPIVGPSMAEATVIDLAGSNFARPRANVTGVMINAGTGNIGKEFELAAEILPNAKRFAYLRDTALGDLSTDSVLAAGVALKVAVSTIDATLPTDLPRVIQECVNERADVVISNGALFNSEQRQLISLVEAARLPAIYGYTATVHAGGLAAYGSDLAYSYRRAAEYVDRVLKGAKPADLPIDVPQPLLSINLKAAKSLGLTFPTSVLVRADEVIDG